MMDIAGNREPFFCDARRRGVRRARWGERGVGVRKELGRLFHGVKRPTTTTTCQSKRRACNRPLHSAWTTGEGV